MLTRNKVDKNWMILVGLVALFGVILYFPIVSEYLPNPDALVYGLYKDDWNWEAQLGRWMLRFWQNLFGYSINTALVSVVSILMMAIAGLLSAKILGIWSNGGLALSAMLLLASPNVESTLTYYYCSAYYIAAYLLQVIAVAMLLRAIKTWEEGHRKQTILYTLLAMVLGTVSLATYQAYLSIYIVLVVFAMMQSLASETKRWKEIGREVLLFAIACVGMLVMYLVSCRLYNMLHHVALTSGRGFDQMGTLEVSGLWERIKDSYTYFVKYFFGSTLINNAAGGINRRMVHILFFGLLCCAIILRLIRVFRKKGIGFALAHLAMYAFLPLGCFVMTIVAPGVGLLDTTGALLLPAMSVLYVHGVQLLAETVDGISGKVHSVGRIGTTMVAVLCLLISIQLDNDLQVYAKENMQTMHSVGTQMLVRIQEKMPQAEKKEVYIGGHIWHGNYPSDPILRENANWLVPSYGMVWPVHHAYMSGWSSFFINVMGETHLQYSMDDIGSTPEYQQMGIFPENDSVKVINGVVAVKLSEW